MLTEMLLLPSEFSLQHVGLAGSLLYMTSFMLLSLRILSGDSVAFFILNLTAASLVLLSLSQAFNAASFLIQTFWIVVSVLSIIVRLRRGGRQGRSTGTPLTQSTDRLRPLN